MITIAPPVPRTGLRDKAADADGGGADLCVSEIGRDRTPTKRGASGCYPRLRHYYDILAISYEMTVLI